MTSAVLALTRRGMGRPPLNVKPILVRLPNGVPEQIDAMVGKNRRAEFIREAINREIKRRGGSLPKPKAEKR